MASRRNGEEGRLWGNLFPGWERGAQRKIRCDVSVIPDGGMIVEIDLIESSTAELQLEVELRCRTKNLNSSHYCSLNVNKSVYYHRSVRLQSKFRS